MNTHAQPFTLARANALLAEAGICTRLRAEDTGRFKRVAPLPRIVAVFTRASQGDASARQWILNTIAQAALQTALPLFEPAEAASQQPALDVERGDNGKPAQAPSTDAPVTTTHCDPAPQAVSIPDPQSLAVLVHAGNTALRVIPDDGHASSPGVVIEVASNGRTPQGRHRLPLSGAELPIVTAALLGYMAHCVCDPLGPEKDSGLEIRNQGRRAMVRLWAKDHPLYSVSIGPGDVYALTALLIRQLRVAQPWLDGAALSLLLKSVGSRVHGRLPSGAS